MDLQHPDPGSSPGTAANKQGSTTEQRPDAADDDSTASLPLASFLQGGVCGSRNSSPAPDAPARCVASSPNLVLHSTSAQQHTSLTEPSTPTGDAAELIQAKYWQPLHQEQQQRPASRQTAAAQGDGVGLEPAQHTDSCPVSPLSPSSTHLLQQLHKLQRQLNMLTYQAAATTGSRPAEPTSAQAADSAISASPARSAQHAEAMPGAAAQPTGSLGQPAHPAAGHVGPPGAPETSAALYRELTFGPGPELATSTLWPGLPDGSAQGGASNLPAQEGPNMQAQPSPATHAPGASMQAVNNTALPVQASSAESSFWAPELHTAVRVQAETSAAGVHAPAPVVDAQQAVFPGPGVLQAPVHWPAQSAAPAGHGFGMLGGPAGLPLTAPQQLQQLLFLQQAQMLQMHMQAAATQGSHGMAWQAPALQPLQAPAAVWGMPVGVAHPAMQQQQQPMWMTGALAPQFPAPPGVASRQTSAAVHQSNDAGTATARQHAADESGPAEHSSSSTAAPATQSLSPFAAAGAGTADSSAAGKAGSFLAACMRLSRRRTAAIDTTAVQPRQGPMALTGGTTSTATAATITSTAVQLALLPLTVVVGGSSLMLQGLWNVGSTAGAVSAWSAHSAAMVGVRLSQYQLLALLFCLTAAAATAQAVGAAAAAAVYVGCVVLQCAHREASMFARAAAVVACTDLKQLCRQLATQPLLASHASSNAASLGASSDSSASAEGPSGARSLRMGLSGLLGGMLGSGLRSSPCAAAVVEVAQPGSRRESSSSQELVAVPQQPLAAGILTQSAAEGQAWWRPSAGVPGVSEQTLVLYDSLAVVSGLWTGLVFRLCVLIMLQVPLAAARIWLQVVSAGVHMSAAATAESAHTAVQAAWGLSHLSLAVLGSAAATGLQASNTIGSGRSHVSAAGADEGSIRLGVGSSVAAVFAALQWVCVLVARPCITVLQCLGMAVAATVPGGKPAANLLCRAHAAVTAALRVLAAMAAAVGCTTSGMWQGSETQSMGLRSVGLRGAMSQVVQLTGLCAAWVVSWVLACAEGAAVLVAEWVLKGVSPVGKAAVYGSARMIRGLVVEAGRQSGQLAWQLFEAWRGHVG